MVEKAMALADGHLDQQQPAEGVGAAHSEKSTVNFRSNS
jgi:hypothetical protein